MQTAHARKWTSFYLSLAVPGAGQLWAKSAWCVAWWLGLILILSAWSWAEAIEPQSLIPAGRIISLIAISLLSAEHAKRLAEHPTWPRLPPVKANTRLAPRRGRDIGTSIELELAKSASEVWRQISDVRRFLVLDTFHDRVVLMRPQPAGGVDLALSHNAFGYKFLRFGRILYWREGQGYAFSDLSPRNPRQAFPHVFFIEIVADGNQPDVTHLRIIVRGKWTHRWIPITIGRWWVYYVSCDHARILQKAMSAA
jgi:hypothetical protein